MHFSLFHAVIVTLAPFQQPLSLLIKHSHVWVRKKRHCSAHGSMANTCKHIYINFVPIFLVLLISQITGSVKVIWVSFPKPNIPMVQQLRHLGIELSYGSLKHWTNKCIHFLSTPSCYVYFSYTSKISTRWPFRKRTPHGPPIYTVEMQCDNRRAKGAELDSAAASKRSRCSVWHEAGAYII